MTTTIVTRITGGTAKNAPLTNVELDTNFINLRDTADAAVASSATVVTLSGTGALKVPAGTTGQQPTPVDGMIRFNSDINSFEGYQSGAWSSIGGGAKKDVFYENATTLSEDYTITTSKNAMTTGPLTITGGHTVTVPSGSRWVIL